MDDLNFRISCRTGKTSNEQHLRLKNVLRIVSVFCLRLLERGDSRVLLAIHASCVF